MAKDRPLSASQLNLISKARDPGGALISGFDGEHNTARSLVKRGYVTLTKANGVGMWRVELVRRVEVAP
jgi:hypothetical protein